MDYGWSGQLAASLNVNGTSLIVDDVAGLPSLPFRALIDGGTRVEEIVTVTASSGPTLTVTRASDKTQDGTKVAFAHDKFAPISYIVTEATLAGLGGGTTAFIDVRDYGAVLDATGVYDAAVSGGALSTVTSATANFTPADTGKTYYLASTAGAVTTGTLTYVSSTSCTMSVAAGGALTGARLIYGTDDTAAWQSALNAAAKGEIVDCSSLPWRSLCTGQLSVPSGVHLGLTGRGPFDPQTNPAMNHWGPTFVVGQHSTIPFVTLNTGSGVGDFIFYSANQVPPTASTPTVLAAFISTYDSSTAGCFIGKPYMANAYTGIQIYGGRHVIDNPQIGAIANGIWLDHSMDCVTVYRLSVSPYWRICEGMAWTPTAGTLDAWVLANGWAMQVLRADSFWVDQLFAFGIYGALALVDNSTDSPKPAYGRVGMIDADMTAYGVYVTATNTPGLIVSSLCHGGNSTGVGTAGQYGAVTVTGGSVVAKVVVKAWSLWGTRVGNSSTGAGTTLVVPGTNPG